MTKAMKTASILALALALSALLPACGLLNYVNYGETSRNLDNSKKLRVGMSKAEAKAIMGDPVSEPYSQPNVWFYYEKTRWMDGSATRDECMPLVFDNKSEKLTGWGQDYYKANYEFFLWKSADPQKRD